MKKQTFKRLLDIAYKLNDRCEDFREGKITDYDRHVEVCKEASEKLIKLAWSKKYDDEEIENLRKIIVYMAANIYDVELNGQGFKDWNKAVEEE